MRFIAATALALACTVVAVWVVVAGPANDVDDVGGYHAAASPPGDPVTVTVDAGASTKEIADDLASKGAIALVSSKSVTIVEGSRLEEIADAVAAQGIDRTEFLAAARRSEYQFSFLEELRASQRLDGYLFPAKYPIRKRDTGRDVVQRMLQGFADNVPASVEEQASAEDLTLHEVLTLASIIEREAVVPEERPIMAQVFLKRLRLGIALEADPTVQYAVANSPENVSKYGYWKKELTQEDLDVDSPYNTRIESGLPPGPICSPGLDSIKAVVNPAPTNYQFFVAKPDGSHAFAETFQEHLENIQRYGGDPGTPP
ncbi:MAG: endolytic transglycosylase MltG [Chloroflexi bacterium]|nr:MAG: endolytic transglycosylase MltG [Chloroflexota bacterium]